MQAKIRLGIIYALLTIFGLFMIVPFIWMISTSLMTQSEFNKQEAVFVPKEEYHVWNTDGGQRRILVVQEEADSTVIHVLSDNRPGDGFEPVTGGLEDVYFSTLSASRKVAA